MKVLIGVTSCEQNEERRRAQLETWIIEAWLTPWPVELEIKFFLGARFEAAPDPLCCYLPCCDDYASLPEKHDELVKFALANKFDFLFKCDDDTYLRVDRLLASGFEKYDYVGWTKGRHFASGGPGYWLSSFAMGLLAERGPLDPERRFRGHCDAAVGASLAKSDMYPVHDERYQTGCAADENFAPSKYNSMISLHNCRPEPPIPPSSRPGVSHSASFRRSMYEVHKEFWR